MSGGGWYKEGPGCTEVNQGSFEEQEVDSTVLSLEKNLVGAGGGGEWGGAMQITWFPGLLPLFILRSDSDPPP